MSDRRRSTPRVSPRVCAPGRHRATPGRPAVCPGSFCLSEWMEWYLRQWHVFNRKFDRRRLSTATVSLHQPADRGDIQTVFGSVVLVLWIIHSESLVVPPGLTCCFLLYCAGSVPTTWVFNLCFSSDHVLPVYGLTGHFLTHTCPRRSASFVFLD